MKKVELKIKDKVLVCPLGLGFLGECLENLKLNNITEMCEKLENNPFKWTPLYIYESLKYSGVDLDFTANDIIEWLDEDVNGYHIIGEFNNAFTLSLIKDVPKQEVEESKGKKKPVAKKKLTGSQK